MKIGSLVECINNSGDYGDLCRPELNKAYTVKDFFLSTIRRVKCIRLEEITNRPNSITGIEYGYNIEYWRELLPPMEAEIKELLEEPQLV